VADILQNVAPIRRGEMSAVAFRSPDRHYAIDSTMQVDGGNIDFGLRG